MITLYDEDLQFLYYTPSEPIEDTEDTELLTPSSSR